MPVCDPILLLSPCIAMSSLEDQFEIWLPKDTTSATVFINVAAFINVSSMTFSALGIMSKPESILPIALIHDLVEANNA